MLRTKTSFSSHRALLMLTLIEPVPIFSPESVRICSRLSNFSQHPNITFVCATIRSGWSESIGSVTLILSCSMKRSDPDFKIDFRVSFTSSYVEMECFIPFWNVQPIVEIPISVSSLHSVGPKRKSRWSQSELYTTSGNFSRYLLGIGKIPCTAIP